MGTSKRFIIYELDEKTGKMTYINSADTRRDAIQMADAMIGNVWVMEAVYFKRDEEKN